MTADEPIPEITAWEAPGADDRPAASEALNLDLSGFEGPLDLLLALARTQKVDLKHISLSALADQYLGFIGSLRALKLEIAADYLVMAAWLAFLKSRLIIPKAATPEGEPTGEELAQRLAFRLMRLDAMRDAAARLMARPRLGREVFGRGAPENARLIRTHTHTAQLYDLLKAYTTQRIRTLKPVHVVKPRTVWSIKDARRRIETLIGRFDGSWAQLDLFMAEYLPSAELNRTVTASSFGATLELAREGLIEIRQDAAYGPIFMRRRESGEAWQQVTEGEPRP